MLQIFFLVLIPFVSAFIGWLTNYVAVKMLFHPKKPFRLLFFEIQGIFPKRQDVLARRLGEMISGQLISTEDILGQFLDNEQLSQDMRGVTERYLDDFIQIKLLAKIPMASMFINDALIDKLKESFFEDWDKVMGELKDALATRLEKDVSIKDMIQKKVSEFSSDQLEETLNSILKQEFRFIEIIGGVLGFVIGCVQLVMAWIYTTL